MRENSAARFYELMTITTPEGTPEELVGVVDQITGYVETAGGTILRANYDSPWGRRRLSYPIRHESQDVRDGFYTLVHLEIEPDKVATIERDLKLNDRLMRYLVLQLAGEPVFPEPEADAAGEGAEATAEPAEGVAPEETATVDEPTAEPVEAAASEDTAEDRRTLVASAEPEVIEVTAESEPETIEEPPAQTDEPAAEITEAAPEGETASSEVKE